MTNEIIPKNWHEYEVEVQKMEAEGETRSDAQATVDARLMSAGRDPITLKPRKK